MPVGVMSAALIASYWLGNTSGLTPNSSADGLFGTAVATMGMLSTAAYVLTMDVFGPIADNAGGIVEMSNQPESVREITDLLVSELTLRHSLGVTDCDSQDQASEEAWPE